MIYQAKHNAAVTVEMIAEAELRIGETKRQVIVYTRNGKNYVRPKAEFYDKLSPKLESFSVRPERRMESDVEVAHVVNEAPIQPTPGSSGCSPERCVSGKPAGIGWIGGSEGCFISALGCYTRLLPCGNR